MLRWTERQRALLKAMGIGQFWPDERPAMAVEPAEVAEPVSQLMSEQTIQPPALQTTPVAPARQGAPMSAAVAVQPASPPAPNLRRPVADGLTWDTLPDAVRQCQACGLCQQRKQAVVGVGHAQARWMLVGEAPGEQEDLRGEPFVGRAGQLLDRMLVANGLTREPARADQQVYIANVIKCRPPGNRNPTPEEVQQCEPYLIRQVQLVQPKLMVAMGRFAAQTLLRTQEPIGRLRGRIHHYEGIPLVVTYHPAYLLRNPADKGLAWDDWCLAREHMASLG